MRELDKVWLDGLAANAKRNKDKELNLIIKKAKACAENPNATNMFAFKSVYQMWLNDRKERLERNKQYQSEERHLPVSVVEKAIKKAKENLEEWANKLITDPARTLSWGGEAFEKAAKIQIYMELLEHLANEHTKESVKKFIETCNQKALSYATMVANSRSTSQTANLMDDHLLTACANVVRKQDRVVDEVLYWFNSKDKIEKEAEELQADVEAFRAAN